ncbi:MAG: hypothetical protein ACFB51_11380, partial [Anaerolineae bacterium]
MAGPLIIQHIPKTGGTTLWAITTRMMAGSRFNRVNAGNFHENTQALRAILAEQPPRYDAIIAHAYADALIPAPGPHRKVVLLRDPVERAVSFYYYALRDRAGNLAYYYGEDDPTLLTAAHRRPADFQTRLVAGVHGETVTPADLQRAKDNLAQHFDVFGLTERFDEMLIWLQQVMGWGLPLYRRYKKGRNRPRAIPPEVRAVLEDRNPNDRDLYAYACALFEERIREVPDRWPGYRRAQADPGQHDPAPNPHAGSRHRHRRPRRELSNTV